MQAAGKTEQSAGAEAYARLKTLAGEWEADSSMGKLHVSYEAIAGGTSLVERESSDKMPAMVTVYYLDGERLLLTHYCMAGNQPRMEAQGFDPATGEVQFRFLDATNLKPGDGHMHNATMRLTDNEHFSSQWEFYQNGQLKRAETAQYTRVK
jgi:hypothetical protein